MVKARQLIRLGKIIYSVLKYLLNRRIVSKRLRLLYWLSYLNPWSYIGRQRSAGEAIRLSLEALGPIFVKFGQLLSTRQDILSPDIINELTKLQDSVPPFPYKQSIQAIEKSFGQPITVLFQSFDNTPLASASIAQVHRAKLLTGESVVVKVRRPKIDKIIKNDIALLFMMAKLAEFFLSHGRQLRAKDMVAEFEGIIFNELDFMYEAANASFLRHNFAKSTIVTIPKIHWEYCHADVYTMEYVSGTQISDRKALERQGANFKKLAETLVEIFFTEAFDDNFFHADMHPGNILVDVSQPDHPVFKLVDFGIMGSLSESDQHYLAHNLLAFIERDYRKVAVLHIECGWIPAGARVDQVEAAFRTVCEPVFERPRQEVSFGNILLRLIQTAERFNMQVQPQLLLLQKTLLNVESLSRQLYPELNLWHSAKPFLEKYVKKQNALLPLAKDVLTQVPEALRALSKSPALSYELLQRCRTSSPSISENSNHNDKTTSQKRGFFFGAASAFALVGASSWLHPHVPHWLHHAALGSLILAAVLFIIAVLSRR